MKVEYEVIIREVNSMGYVVRNVSLMKTSQKQRAISYFHEKVANTSYLLNNGTEIMVVKHNGDDRFDVIRKTKGSN